MEGYLAVVLHSHLPYVRHLEDPNALEQRWLFEAITESYIPLLNVFNGLISDGVRFRFTLSLTPPLMEMLADPVMQERYLRHLDSLIELCEKEAVRVGQDSAFRAAVDMYRWKLKEARWVFTDKYGGNLLNGFRALANAGVLELITSAATHAYLPLLQTTEAVRAQIATGVEAFRYHLGFKPRGIWLPECGYRNGIDEILAEFGLRFFVVDSHAVLHADPAPITGVYAPVRTRAGVLAFARDKESAKQVWSSKEGYPGDYVYREYYRDIGWDLDWDYIKPYVHPDGIRVNTGLKYYRITGNGPHKEPYVPAWADARAADHAGHFIHARWEQAQRLHSAHGQPPIIVSPYDTELFGHWWYEGPAFLNYLCRKLHFDQDALTLISPLDYPHNGSAIEADLPESSWGNEGYNAVWLNERNWWAYRHLHAAEERMAALAESRRNVTPLEKRALNQAARELMLAQSSDWAFILNAGTAIDYARRRTLEHLGWFFSLCEQLEQGQINEALIDYLEKLHPIFPYLDYRKYERPNPPIPLDIFSSPAMRVLMLSWEFPPITVGGLGRHVCELSRALAQRNIEVHVVTSGGQGLSECEMVEGVCVHRTPGDTLPGDSFMDWVFQFNLQIVEIVRKLVLRKRFDVLHGHDWLVGEASRILARRYRIPLLATIHATEYGRNNGIHNDMQRAIDHVEREMMQAADRVIVCSRAMRDELVGVFGVPDDLLHVIPNGVDINSLVHRPGQSQLRWPESGLMVSFWGRFVREKGVELLLEAAGRLIPQWHGDLYFTFAGRGPLLDQLRHRAEELGIADRVIFPGFLNDRERNGMLARTALAVFPSLYEPFGIVALEAMGAGVPVIVSDTGGLAEIVEHEVDGWKVQPGNLDHLVDTIAWVLSHQNEARQVAERGRQKTMSQYTWGAVADQTCQVYRLLMSANKKEEAMAAVQ